MMSCSAAKPRATTVSAVAAGSNSSDALIDNSGATHRQCAACGQQHNPYKMHFCAICHILYCTPACAVSHWPHHRTRCIAERDAVFVADVIYSLRAAQLTTCIHCHAGCRRNCIPPAIDPRLTALGLDPVVILWPCRQGAEGAADVLGSIQASALAAAKQRQQTDFTLFPVLNSEICQQLATGKVIADSAALCRLWTACRIAASLLFRKLLRDPAWAEIEELLLNSLRSWCSIGRALSGALAPAPVVPAPALTASCAAAARLERDRARAEQRRHLGREPGIAWAPAGDLYLAFQALQFIIDANWAE